MSVEVCSRPPLMLVAHGSRDPRSAAMIEALVRRVAAARPGLPVAAASLEHRGSRPVEVARALTVGGARALTVVPLLLTRAYHTTVDIPVVLADIRDALPAVQVAAGRGLGPDDRLLDALDERLRTVAPSDVDGLVLAAAGTRDRAALAVLAATARRYGHRHGVPCVPACAAGGSDVPSAVDRLHAVGAHRIVVVSYFLAPGLLHDRIVSGGRSAGIPVTAPFGATAPVAGLTLARYDAARDSGRSATAVGTSGIASLALAC